MCILYMLCENYLLRTYNFLFGTVSGRPSCFRVADGSGNTFLGVASNRGTKNNIICLKIWYILGTLQNIRDRYTHREKERETERERDVNTGKTKKRPTLLLSSNVVIKKMVGVMLSKESLSFFITLNVHHIQFQKLLYLC